MFCIANLHQKFQGTMSDASFKRFMEDVYMLDSEILNQLIEVVDKPFIIYPEVLTWKSKQTIMQMLAEPPYVIRDFNTEGVQIAEEITKKVMQMEQRSVVVHNKSTFYACDEIAYVMLRDNYISNGVT